MDEIDGTIKERLLAVYKLQQEGATEGERVAAQKALDRLLKRYGVTMEQLLASATEKRKAREFGFTEEWERKLIVQIYSKVCGVRGELEYSVHRNNGRRKNKMLWLDCTEIEYVEMLHLFAAYRKAFAEQFNVFLAAFIQKNKLFPPPSGKNDGTSMSADDYERLMRMMHGIKKTEVAQQHNLLSAPRRQLTNDD